jgi:predicted O-linked N-acetylglucosamine transferase (SPINDLY family)
MLELEDDSYILMAQLYSRMMICDWDAFESALSEIVDKTKQGNAAFSPFPLLPLTDSPDLQLRAAETYAADKYPVQSGLGPIPERTPHERIRIGYYSADYRNHATTYLIAELFEAHDKEKFELIGFSYGPDQKDEMRERVVAAFDRFIDIRDMSDIEVAELSRELEIDIAVDLKGYTEDARSGIFSYRAAPVQVSYLGYPGTMGASYIDYIIADSTVITAESQPYFSESVVYLPGSYQVNDSKRKISERLFTREELGLPDDGFVFCCFNKNYKITPRTFDSWMRILGEVNNSVLWLFEKNDAASANLRKQAERQGIDPGRLIFVTFLPLDEHLARHRAADLFIDTFPYNAHTTASDALWSGLPVLTCAGESFASRVGASLLNAIEMPELITSTHEEYEALAVELASNPDKLAQVRNKLQDNRMTTPLFDAQLFTQNLEKAYRAMYQKYQTGQPASHMYIE